MIERVLRSIENGNLVIKETKKRNKEIFIRVRLESGQIVRVNKCKEGSKKSLKDDEIVVLELAHIIDLRNNENESLFLKKWDNHTNFIKQGINKIEKNISFRFTIHHGLQFNLKTVSFRALDNAQYFNWITGLKYLVDRQVEMPYESLVERWLWKHYYQIAENVTEGKIKGPIEIDNEFIIPISHNKAISSSLGSLPNSKEASKSDSNSMWSDESTILSHQRRFSLNKSIGNLNSFKTTSEKCKTSSLNNIHHFRRYSWCSNISSNMDSLPQHRFASPDSSACQKTTESFNLKIFPKQLKIWLAQQNGTKIVLDNIKEYYSNYQPKPNYIDFNGFAKIYKELLYQPETFIKIIEQRMKKLQKRNPFKSMYSNIKINESSLNRVDREWLQSIRHYSIDYNFQELNLDSLFNSDNSIWDPKRGEEVYQNMDLSLSEYYISTSHNSYLTGDQITSKSSCEAYTRCIQMGCRSVELDCWNGDRDPIIYHGNTLTSKIKLLDVLQTIKRCCWQKSAYPLILSLEDHCDIQQQIIIAQMMQEVFQEDLLRAPIKLDNPSFNQLPSPNQLKNKIILKHKKLPIDSLTKSGSQNGINDVNDDYNDNELSNYLHYGRMYMKDLFLDSWTPYYFLLTQNRSLVYTEDTSLNSGEHNSSQISFSKSKMQSENSSSDLQNVDNSARFITIDHGESLAINCNGCIPSELTNKTKLPNWFYGSLSRSKASSWLLRYWFLGDGTFLIRTSESFPGSYSLSFYRKDKVHHVKICRFVDTRTQRTSLGFEHCDIQFITLEDLVTHYQENDMVALDFKIRLKNPPPERFQDNSWFYENPPVNTAAVEEILGKIPLTGSFLVSRKRKENCLINGNNKHSLEQFRNFNEDQFVLSYKSRGNVIIHSTINYDGFQYSISGHSSNSLVELICYFHKNRLSDGIRLKYPADSNLIKKCNLLCKVSSNNNYIKNVNSILDFKKPEFCSISDNSICPSVTADDLLSLHQDQEDELALIDEEAARNRSQKVKIAESIQKIKLQDNDNGDILNTLENTEMDNFQLDSDCYVKIPTANMNNDSFSMFYFDLYIAYMKVQLACETEQQRTDWISAINNCLNSETYINVFHSKKEMQHKIAKLLSDLIIYCNSVPFNWPDNPKDFNKLLYSPCKDMSSISENRFLKLLSIQPNNVPSYPEEVQNNNNINKEIFFTNFSFLVQYHQFHLTRVYPKASRLDSSNLSPTIPWLCGVQMAAINFQTPDRALQLNQALFRDNGGCGYVQKNSMVFLQSQHLEITLTFLGARHLPGITKGLLEIEIISIYDELCDKKSFPLKSEFRVTDVDIPDIYFLVKNPNLAFIRFAFGTDEKLGQKKRMNSCQATFLVRGIRPGIRSVNLRNGFDYSHDLATLLFHVNLSIIESKEEQ